MRPFLANLLVIAGCSGCFSSCYYLPTWHGEVVVHAYERSSLAKCGTGELTPAGRMQLTRWPYLQSTTTTSVRVAWGSREGTEEVELSEPGGAVVQRVRGSYVGDPARGPSRLLQQKDRATVTADSIYVSAAAFEKLDPTHLYCYRLVRDKTALTELAPLTTAASPGLADPIRFVALGDTGTAGDAEKAIAQRITEVPFDFLLFLGDIAYEEGSAYQLQHAFFEIYAGLLRYVTAYPTIGNHERRTAEGKPYFEAFVLPEPERYYSFDWGDVHFVAIDTTHRDAAQLVWLAEDLAKTKQPWKIVFGHHPMYTNSYRGPQLWIRRAFAKILTDHKVDIVLTGHEHQYERFRVADVNYVISGGGGGRLTKFFGHSKALKQATRHRFLSFEVTAKRLAMKAIDIDGKEIETLELTKATPTSEPKAKVNDKPEPQQSPQPVEQKTEPDPKLHDEPEDDKKEGTPVKPPPST